MKHYCQAIVCGGLLGGLALAIAGSIKAAEIVVELAPAQLQQFRNQVVIQRGGAAVAVRMGPVDGRKIVLVGNDLADEHTGPRTDGFQVAAGGAAIEDTAAGEAITHLDNRDWFKAISAIEQLGEAEDDQLVVDRSGVLRPVSSLRQSLIEALPEEGRQVFRMLNGPAADAKLAEARELGDLAERGVALEVVLNRYALCDAAAKAASGLGDLRFEAGRFDEAADLYAIAAKHVGSPPDDARLMCKRLHALARAGRWSGFDELAQYANFRHGQTTVELGGKPVALAQVVQTLSANRDVQPVGPVLDSPPLILPTASYPTFSIRLSDEKQDYILRAVAQQNRFAGNLNEILHPAVVAGHGRVYTLHVDNLVASDAQTGSELWRQGDPEESAVQISNNFYYLQMDYQQSLVLHDQTLLVTNSDPESMNWSRLRAIDSKTGQERWNSRSVGAIANESFVGRPTVIGETVYCVAREGAGNALKLIGMSLDSAGGAWSVPLGTAVPDPNWNQPVDLQPRVVMGDRYLIVLTNNGAVIAVDPQTKAIAWAYAYPILASTRQRRGRFELPTAGGVVCQGGVVFSKDTRDNRIHAIRERDGLRLWSLPVRNDETLIHADERHLYLLGDQLTALDLATGKAVWWSPHAGSEAGTPIFTRTECLVLGNQRTCRIDLTTGKVSAYRDDLATENRLGGLVQTGDMIGFVDRDWIRFYRIAPEDPGPITGDLTP